MKHSERFICSILNPLLRKHYTKPSLNEACYKVVVLYLQDWASVGDIDNLNLKWHIPSEEELQFVTEIFQKILQPELTALQQVSDSNTMSR